jgi:hypothetical protein
MQRGVWIAMRDLELEVLTFEIWQNYVTFTMRQMCVKYASTKARNP